MPLQFSKHYTVEEVRALLPEVRRWLDSLEKCADRLKILDKKVGTLLDLGAALQCRH